MRAAAALGLVVLLFVLALPLIGVLADEPPPFCCSKGRCCCADGARGADEASCLRRGCGCRHSDEALAGALLRLEAVLSASALVSAAPPCEGQLLVVGERPLARADEPTVPPPRRSLPA